MPVFETNGVIVEDIILYNYRGTPVSLNDITKEFVVYHDLMIQGIRCDIMIDDAKGLIEMAPIVGDENILLRFKSPNTEKLREYSFRVYKVGKRKKTNERSESFVLQCCSHEIINNNRKSINRSYIDQSGDNIIKGIYASFLEPQQNDFVFIRKKNLYLQQTDGNHSFVFTGEKPLDCINYICKESQAKIKGFINQYDYQKYKTPSNQVEFEDQNLSSNFVFYESYDGWYLNTFDYLMSQEPVNDFYLMKSDVENKKTIDQQIKPYQIIINIKQVKQVDTLENINTGIYSHKVETIDPITKRFTTDIFSYDRDSKYITHLEKDKSLYAKNSLFGKDSNSSITKYMISNIGEDYSNQSFLVKAKGKDPQIRNPRKLHKWFKYEYASRLQLNNIVLEVTIPGNTNIKIGDVINIHMPQNTENKEYMKKDNLLYGNKFFVTALRHNINSVDQNFFTTLECIKDVYAKDIIEEEIKLTTSDFEGAE